MALPNQRDRRVPTRQWFVPLAAVYATFGVFWGAFGVGFLDFIETRQLTFAEAGNRLAGLSVASIVVMLLVAQHLGAFPRRWSVSASIVLNGAAVMALVLVPDGWLLAAFLLVGAGTGLTDVFVNAAGQEVEARSRRPILQGLHAVYAIGAGIGALATGMALQRGVPLVTTIVVAALSQVLVGVIAVLVLPADRPIPEGRRRRLSFSVFAAAPFLLIPAMTLAAAYFVEGAIGVWGVLYLRAELGASPVLGSWGLAVFSFAMAAGRLFAARTLFHLGHRATLLVSGLGSMVAGLVAVAVDEPVAASAAFLGLGFFLAAASPAAIGMVGRAGVEVSAAIAAIQTLGYIGFVLGPALTGWLAEGVGVRLAMVVAVATTTGIVLSGVLSSPRQASQQPR